MLHLERGASREGGLEVLHLERGGLEVLHLERGG